MTAFSLNEVNLKKLRAFLIVPHCGPVTNDLRYRYRSADLGLGTPAVIGYPGKLFILPLPCDKCKQVKSDANAMSKNTNLIGWWHHVGLNVAQKMK